MRVKNIVNKKGIFFNTQQEVKEVIQKEFQVRFTLCHKTLIIQYLLGEKLRHFNNEELAKSIVEGMHEIPTKLDKAIKRILEHCTECTGHRP